MTVAPFCVYFSCTWDFRQAQGLARGGYATDPNYASKLARIAGKLQGTAE